MHTRTTTEKRRFAFRERIITPHGRSLEVVPASLGEMSCWIGSAELAADADQLATRKALA